MPLQNRVTPFGELIADPARGLVYGNRGCLHDDAGRIRRRFNGTTVDRVSPAVPRVASFADDAAGSVHGAVLPRRGHRVRRGTPAVRAVPAGGLRAVRRDLARPAPGTVGGGRDRRPAPRRADRPDDEDPTSPRGAVRIAAPTVRWSSMTASPSSSPVTPCNDGPPPDTRAGGSRPRRGVATVITPPSLVDVLRRGWEPVVPLLHPSSG